MPFKNLLITVVVAFTFAGCNAGTPGTDKIAARSDTIQGAVQYGRVSVSVVGERSIRQIATARTREDGTFTIVLPENLSGILLVEVKAAHDGRSRMVCDSRDGCGEHARGESMPVPASFRMVSLLDATEARSGRISVNPYTHLATHEVVRIPGMIGHSSIVQARRGTSRNFAIQDDFWRDARHGEGSRGQMSGVARASVASSERQLVINGGRIQIRQSGAQQPRVASAADTSGEMLLF